MNVELLLYNLKINQQSLQQYKQQKLTYLKIL